MRSRGCFKTYSSREVVENRSVESVADRNTKNKLQSKEV